MSTSEEHFSSFFPIKAGRFELTLVEFPSEPPRADAQGLYGTFRVIEWDVEDGSVLNIIEQQVWVVPHPVLIADAERVSNCMGAYVSVLSEVFKKWEAGWTPFPSDIVCVGDVLKLKTVNTPEAFEKALRAKKRLGGALEGGA